jgi:hypothetical protein
MVAYVAGEAPMKRKMTRRKLLHSGAAAAGAAMIGGCTRAQPGFAVSAFEADVTSPVDGHPFLAGRKSRSVEDPLFAHGLVLSGDFEPIAIVAVDWCEIRNESYEKWREALAGAAGTSKQRVLLSCVHQHDAPDTDRAAQRFFEEFKVPGALCVVEFEDCMIERVAGAVREGLKAPRPVSRIGTGQARAAQLASNRRIVSGDGKISWGRNSTTRDPAVRALPEGLVDPWVKTISFWDGDEAVAALSCYATHPMSHYGEGDISADFVGMARSMRQRDTPGTKQIYLSGCSGDVTVGKYNDGDKANRAIFAERLHRAMAEAWEATKTADLKTVNFRSTTMRLKPRESPGYSVEDFRQTIADETKSYIERNTAALGLSWRERYDAGHAIDVPCIDFGPAQIVLLPAEAFVQYQLWAQELRPDSFVMAIGYGECAPGYIPTAKDAAEGYDDYYSWIAFPECEKTLRGALDSVLRVG